MAIKLLSKSELVQAKNKDRERDIAEGTKLARRIDSLREVAAAEEASLKKFRDKTLSQLHEDIDREGQKLTELKVEVADLEDRRLRALKPLTEEHTRVAIERSELEREKEDLFYSRTEIEQQKRFAAMLVEDASVQFARAKEDRELVKDLLTQADRRNEDARKALKSAQSYREKTEAQMVSIERAMADRLISVSAREQHQKVRDESQDRREKELNARETKLKDREMTLQRTLKRHA